MELLCVIPATCGIQANSCAKSSSGAQSIGVTVKSIGVRTLQLRSLFIYRIRCSRKQGDRNQQQYRCCILKFSYCQYGLPRPRSSRFALSNYHPSLHHRRSHIGIRGPAILLCLILPFRRLCRSLYHLSTSLANFQKKAYKMAAGGKVRQCIQPMTSTTLCENIPQRTAL